ncbi:MAG TPA: TIR domain-containing protein [Magnetospirillaceae bacterium]|jgi:predicted nucleotide-binding protein
MAGAPLLPGDLANQLAFPKATVGNRIRECVERGQDLLNTRVDGPVAFNTFRANRTKWDDQNREVLRRLFKTDAIRLAYDKTGHVPPGAATPAVEIQRMHDSVADKVDLLQAILDQLEGVASASPGEGPRAGGSGKTPVFVVHVDEPALARTVARVLENQRFSPVIVSNKPGENEIGVSQLDAYREVRFAVVLVAGDQVSSSSSYAGTSRPERVPHGESLMWLGYLAGRVGRKRVCALYQPGLPVPGKDLGMRGVEYDDAGAWKTNLAKRIESEDS